MQRQSVSVILSAVVLSVVLLPGFTSAASRPFNEAEVSALVKTMAADGFERTFLQKIFTEPRVRYVPQPVRMLVIPPNFSANYERFTTKAEIKRARVFKSSQHSCLGTAQQTYGVDADIIVAILLIETSLGSNLGRSPVLSVFASLLLEGSLHRGSFAKTLEANPRKEHFLQRLDDKAAWARGELAALLYIQQKGLMDVCGLQGSYAGAFGIPQFLPTSYLTWAKSAEHGRNPDLFHLPHAIMSVANFLKEHGWKSNLTDDEKRAVIWHYNRSSIYVDTVLAVAAQLKDSVRP
jgi:membrane-bound lytic murein transglycosylase B